MRGLFGRHGSSRTRVMAAALLAITLASTAAAQRFRLPEGLSVPPNFPQEGFDDGRFTICKLMFRSVTSEPNGMGWSTDWPYAGINLMTRLSELTRTPISRDPHGDPNHWVIQLTDPALFRCPMVTASDIGTAFLDPNEVRGLREYLLKGGFLWVDDFWGTLAWNRWAGEIGKALPEFPIVDIEPGHPLLQAMYSVTTIPQVSSINFWMRNGGNTSERGYDSPKANLRAIADDHGRIMVLMTHNTDISDSWERESENGQFFDLYSPSGYALGVNTIIYSLTH